MTTYYQPWLIPFLGWKRHRLPVRVKRYAYHSFEDGLWDLLEKKRVPKGALILLPNFYCVDVLNNIQSHGYRYVLYPVNKHFQIPTNTFHKYITKYKPALIMIFHACGIQSKLVIDTSWMKALPAHTLILEDAVHTLINPETVKLLSDTHFLMDSARKVSPVSGSHLYGTQKGLSYSQTRTSMLTSYTLSTGVYFTLFRVCLMVSELLNLPRLARFAHEILLKKHDDIIGDSTVAHAGARWKTWLFDHFNVANIQKRKREQVAVYRKHLGQLYKNKLFYEVDIDSTDAGNLHVYPVGFSEKPNQTLEKKLHDNGAIVWFKFPDAPWSRDQGVLFLPLGLHIKNRDIEDLSAKLQAIAYTL